MKRLLRSLVIALIVAATIIYFVLVFPLRDKHPALQLPRGTLAVRNATIYISPNKPPLTNATLLARDGRIVAVGTDIPIPPDAQLLPCNNCTVTAGFWNAHVHFTQPKWSNAAWQGRDKLNAQLGRPDFVILSSDPATDPTAFAKIQTTIRSGKVIWQAPGK